MKKILTVLLLISLNSFSQENKCQVELEALKGSYEGECKDNKANGKGKAAGTDTYEGSFKNGLPDGKGKYTWKNGNWYDGEFEEGVLHGKGSMHFKINEIKDSVVEGVWKHGVFDEKSRKLYKLISKSYMISNIAVNANKDRADGNEIIIMVESISGGMKDLDRVIPKPTLIGVDITKGTYMIKSEITNSEKRNIYYLRDVTFPFRAVFRINVETGIVTSGGGGGGGASIEEFELELYQPSSWKIDVKLRQ